MGFSYFTVNLINSDRSYFNQKLTKYKREVLLPHIVNNTFTCYAAITENGRNIYEDKIFKVYDNYKIQLILLKLYNYVLLFSIIRFHICNLLFR